MYTQTIEPSLVLVGVANEDALGQPAYLAARMKKLDPQDLLALKALAHLVNEAGDVLAQTEEAVLPADRRA
jgi:hypothetical protein